MARALTSTNAASSGSDASGAGAGTPLPSWAGMLAKVPALFFTGEAAGGDWLRVPSDTGGASASWFSPAAAPRSPAVLFVSLSTFASARAVVANNASAINPSGPSTDSSSSLSRVGPIMAGACFESGFESCWAAVAFAAACDPRKLWDMLIVRRTRPVGRAWGPLSVCFCPALGTVLPPSSFISRCWCPTQKTDEIQGGAGLQAASTTGTTPHVVAERTHTDSTEGSAHARARSRTW